jgi:predicted RNase H-like HicB family nuclease
VNAAHQTFLAFAGERAQNKSMKRVIQVRITKGENYYVAECLDLAVVTQGKTLDELKENLQEAIALHLEDK